MTTNQAALDVLSNYVGTWDMEATVQGVPCASGTATAQWTLDKNFIHSTGGVKTVDGSNDFDLISIMTYDSGSQVYRTWSFLSNGMTMHTEGEWDASTRTMTEVTHFGNITQTTESNFTDDGVRQWTTVNLDSDGNVLSEMSGTHTRRDHNAHSV